MLSDSAIWLLGNGGSSGNNGPIADGPITLAQGFASTQGGRLVSSVLQEFHFVETTVTDGSVDLASPQERNSTAHCASATTDVPQ